MWPRAPETDSDTVRVSEGLSLPSFVLSFKDEHDLACARALWDFYLKRITVGLRLDSHQESYLMTFSSANWVNHLQPLYIAGEVFGRSSSNPTSSPGGHESVISAAGDDAMFEEKHAAEKIALLKHLGKIERETGWKTSGRASQLRTMWGIG